jgi:hypothetical protein
MIFTEMNESQNPTKIFTFDFLLFLSSVPESYENLLYLALIMYCILILIFITIVFKLNEEKSLNYSPQI